MLTPKKHLSKKELKEDALVTTYVKATSFLETHRRNILIGVTALIVVVIVALLYSSKRSENNVKASAELGTVFALYDEGQYQMAVDGMKERGVTGLKEIVENYGNSNAGDIARFYLGNAYLQLGKNDEAIEQLKKYSPSEPTFEISRLSALGCASEAKGSHKEAAEYFEKAATKDPKDVNAAENLNNAARNYAQAGDKATAIDLYKRLKKEYPTTPFGREADRGIVESTL